MTRGAPSNRIENTLFSGTGSGANSGLGHSFLESF